MRRLLLLMLIIVATFMWNRVKAVSSLGVAWIIGAVYLEKEWEGTGAYVCAYVCAHVCVGVLTGGGGYRRE